MRTLLALLAALAAAPAAAPAAVPVTAHLNAGPDGACPRYGELEVCSGQVPSFDGSPLDVDVTKPLGPRPAGGHPLVLMVHGGAGNNGADGHKREFESLTDEGNGGDRYRWNSHWFARRGFYVVTYTQRGYRTEGSAAPWQPATPAGSSAALPNGTIRLTSREFSVRDAQWLTANVARSFDVDTDRIVVTGRASGGGESWLLASQHEWTFPHERDPSLPVLRPAAALPRTTWTDLGYSFLPHGHGGGPGGDDPELSATSSGPLGTPRASFLMATYALVANRSGILEAGTGTTPSEEGRPNLHAWFARGMLGDLGPEDPLIAEVRRGLTTFRSPYYQPGWRLQHEQGRRVPIHVTQGWTDDLFAAVEAFRGFRMLKAIDPDWPIAVSLGDVGNPRARNDAGTWRELNAEAWAWLDAQLDGRPSPVAPVTSRPTVCDGARPGRVLTARRPSRLGRGTLTVAYDRGARLTHVSGAADPNGPATDPALSFAAQPLRPGCVAAAGPATGGSTQLSPPLRRTLTYAGLGEVRARYRVTGTPASVHVRLFDVPPDGDPLLVSRGTYRLDAPAHDPVAGELRIPLFGNHWRLRAGHRLRLDVVQVDQPAFRAVNAPSTVELGAPVLELPVAERGDHRAGTIPAGTWEARGRTTVPRQEVAAARIGRFAYVVGGFDDQGPSTVVERYDLDTGRWSRVAPLPYALNHTTAVAHDGRLYVAGGYMGDPPSFLRSDGLAVALLLEYDPAADRWRELAPPPVPRGAAVAGVVGDELLLAGGFAPSQGELARLDVYDFTTGTWRRGPDMAQAREHAAGAASGGRLYVLGGRADPAAATGNLVTAERFDPRTDRWKRIADLPRGHSGAAAAAVPGGVVIAGGESEAAVVAEAEAFDACTGRWRALAPMPTPRHALGGVARGRVLWTFAGSPSPRVGSSDVVEALTVPAARCRARRAR